MTFLENKMLLSLCVAVLAVFLAYYFRQIYTKQKHSEYRFKSFSPVRINSRAQWYVDGQHYMSAVADAIQSAKYEILITDYQLNPEIVLKRPDTGVDNSTRWRLDKMLMEKAKENVRICILLYYESIIDLGSQHAANLFHGHANIEVHRHPGKVVGLTNPDTLFRWAHHEKMVIVDRSIVFLGGIDLAYGRWDTRNHNLTDYYPPHPSVVRDSESDNTKLEAGSKYARWIGKDYRNTFYNIEEDWEQPFVDYKDFDRRYFPRMPWHDVACAFTGDAVMDAVKHFIQRYDALYPWWWKMWTSVTRMFMSTKFVPNEHSTTADMYDVNIQVLRSVGGWSAGQTLEDSIYNAYIAMIENAKHYIYIENQFFISSQDGFWIKARNKIQSALVDRIARAHQESEDFHVVFITPLKPEFPGTLGSDDLTSDALNAITRWNQVTIFHGKDSLFEKLKERNISKETAEKYFSVYSLRTLELLDDYFMTEIIYVHSKLMIIDDRFTIVGSANINDRSMLGERDSEVAVIIEDTDMVEGKMNGKPYKFGKFSHSLRCDLLKEHLGLLGEEDPLLSEIVDDPLADGLLQLMEISARLNTAAYISAFFWERVVKEDLKAEDTADEDLFQLPLKNTASSQEKLQSIKGNLVKYPSHMLVEKLKPSKLDFIHLYVNRKVPDRTTLWV